MAAFQNSLSKMVGFKTDNSRWRIQKTADPRWRISEQLTFLSRSLWGRLSTGDRPRQDSRHFRPHSLLKEKFKELFKNCT